MWWKTFRRSSTKTGARFISSPSTPPTPTPLTTANAQLPWKITRITRYYGRKCGDPVFKLINLLVNDRFLKVPEPILRRSNLPMGELIRFKPIVWSTSWTSAMPRYVLCGVEAPDASGDPGAYTVPLPTWLVLFVLSSKVKKPDEALQALALAHQHLPHTPQHLRPALLSIAACRLAEHSLLVPLIRTVSHFTGSYSRDYEFDVLLQLLAVASSHRNACETVPTVLQAARERNVRLNNLTYNALLASRMATPSFAGGILRHMRTQGHLPTIRQLTHLIALLSRGDTSQRNLARRCTRFLRQEMLRRHNGAALDGTDWGELEDTPTSIDSESTSLSTLRSLKVLHSAVERVARLQRLSEPYSLHFSGLTTPNLQVDNNDPDKVVTHGSSFPLPHIPRVQPIWSTAGSWRSSLRVASRDYDVPADRLLHLLERAKSAHHSLHNDISIHTFTLRGLVLRQEFTAANSMWAHIRSLPLELPRWSIMSGLEALTLGGHADTAFVQLLEYAERGLVDTQMINNFLLSLERVGRYDAVYAVWKGMGTLFDVLPDVYTLTVLLKSARRAMQHAPILRGALMRLGLGNWFDKRDGSINEEEDARDYAVQQVQRALDPTAQPSTGLWDGKHPGTVALIIARQILLGNYPELREIQSPSRPIQPSGNSKTYSPITDYLRSVMGHTQRPVASSPHTLAPAFVPCDPTYAQILPTDLLFRAYIALLESDGQTEQIPIALAWMRYLGVGPSRYTLAMALVGWAEVSMDAPLVEHLKGGRSEYRILLAWLKEWVGEQGMPGKRVMQQQMLRLRYFREDHLRKRPRDYNRED
ncbi:hypothetical protein WOLCODRAFT_25712 [Wolfiporia cocos MD-104 SS10]|uniref:Uncharacterized protein n=1 Tax=Wolfiporia cocos (strain MD-104) TaxID=742152 RepID=A0A2H3JMH6_WOLCO|nr:hypothetical protein WOLCODRAFT_25712 [Wolfiporia cocos MD-104 SS10]